MLPKEEEILAEWQCHRVLLWLVGFQCKPNLKNILIEDNTRADRSDNSNAIIDSYQTQTRSVVRHADKVTLNANQISRSNNKLV